MKKGIFIIVLVLIVIIIAYFYFYFGLKYAKWENNFEVGKTILIEINDDIIIDSDYILKEFLNESKYSNDGIDLLGEKKRLLLAEYMKKNNLIIEPGKYKINQAWPLDKIIENFKFKEIK